VLAVGARKLVGLGEGREEEEDENTIRAMQRKKRVVA
jgi:hypothetical protein